MNSPGHYHSMTDDQLAEWHQHTTRIDQLERELHVTRTAAEADRVAAEAECAKLRSELLCRADTITDLAMKLADRTSQVRRNGATIVVVMGALEKLHNAVRAAMKKGAPLTTIVDLMEAAYQADEVIRIHGIPF